MSKLGLALLLVLSTKTSFAQTAPENPISQASWRSAVLGRVQFDQSGDLRRSVSDRWRHAINPRGLITGEDLLGPARIKTREQFETELKNEAKGDAERLYQEYLRGVLDHGIALLTLNRVIDNEAMKKKMSPDVLPLRSFYVMRAVLIENAVSTGMVKTRRVKVPLIPGIPPSPWGAETPSKTQTVPAEDMSLRSNDELYGWLRTRVVEAIAKLTRDTEVKFNIDWTYKLGGLEQVLADLARQDPLSWNQVSVVFPCSPKDPEACLPRTWQGFQEQIAQKLNVVQRSMIRTIGWGMLFRRYVKDYEFARIEQHERGEVEGFYEAMKDRMFKVAARRAEVIDFTVSGARAQEFTARFNALLMERQEQLLAELFPKDGPQPGPEEREALKKRIEELRGTVPVEVMAATQLEFSDAIEAGEIQLVSGPRVLEHKDTAELPTDDSIESRQKRGVFNPMFEAMSFLPKLEMTDQDQNIRLLFLKKMSSVDAGHVGLDHKGVRPAIEKALSEKKLAALIRSTAYKALSANRLVVATDTCTQAPWPCIEYDAKRLTEALFPEVLFPNEELGSDKNGQPITSTVERPWLLEKVAEIPLNLFYQVFMVPNDHR